MYKRNCPDCAKDIFHTTRKACNKALKKNSKCRSCSRDTKIPKILERNCPNCKKLLLYTNKYARNNAEQKNCLCDSCKGLLKNGFKGKHHTEETKKKITLNKDWSSYRTTEFREKISKITKGRPGKSIYKIWLEKYGKEEADARWNEFKKKQSVLNSGKNNNMYGKPSPNGSGNGWKGWYKDYFFRSLLELSYIVNTLEINQVNWKSAENIHIEYLNYDGSHRTYRADFVVDDKILVECKPEKLINTPLVQLKKLAAEKYCSENNLEYLLITPKKLSFVEIDKMVNEGLVRFSDKYKEKYKKWKMKEEVDKSMVKKEISTS